MFSDSDCTFCGARANTREHVLPKWLIGHFDLWNQSLGLWNDTALRYRQLMVPACAACNNERFSRLEERVRDGVANDQELFLWALKIRFGLAAKDTAILMDRADRDSGPLTPQEVAGIDERAVRAMLGSIGRQPPPLFQPFPFGSVFQFPLPSGARDFNLMDMPPPWWGLGITVPKTLLVVLFTDRRTTSRLLRKLDLISRYSRAVSEEGAKGMSLLMFSLVALQSRLRVPQKLYVSDNKIRSARVPRFIPIRPADRQTLRRLAASCWLESEVAEEAIQRQLKLELPSVVEL